MQRDHRPSMAESAGRPIRRDRHGRGLRGPLAPPEVPLTRTAAQRFDDLVRDGIEELEERWAADLARVEFAVEDVPPEPDDASGFDPDVVADRGVPLGRLHRAGAADEDRVVMVVYRRPVQARASDRASQAELVFEVLA
ncbi:MAG: metallopeptidase family protein, partial [Actinomycetia bacterium]|nr:metallopeptidase family protein [Actinomycetes bacterium]